MGKIDPCSGSHKVRWHCSSTDRCEGALDGDTPHEDFLEPVYFDSMVKFTLSCADHDRLPSLSTEEPDLGNEEQARKLVSQYFSLRREKVLEDWREYRKENPDSSLQHLRNFIKADFQIYRVFSSGSQPHEEVCRDEDCSGELQVCTFVLNHPEPHVELEGSIRKELTLMEIERLIRVAMEIGLAELDVPEAERGEMRLLAERRVLRQQSYRQFASSLSCSEKTARQRVFRFKRRLHTVLRKLLNVQGDAIFDILSELQDVKIQGFEADEGDTARHVGSQGEIAGLGASDIKRLLEEACPSNSLSFFLKRIEQEGGQAWVENVFVNTLLKFDFGDLFLAKGSSEAFLVELKERAEGQMAQAEHEVVLEQAACLHALAVCLILSQEELESAKSLAGLSRSQAEDLLYVLQRELKGEWATRIERALATIG